MQLIRRIANNFYLRNLVVLALFISPNVLQSIGKHGFKMTDILHNIMSYTAFYAYFVFHSTILYEKLLAKKKYVSYILALLVTMFVWREGTSYIEWLVVRPPGEHVYEIRELKLWNATVWVFTYWADVIDIYIALGVYLAFKYFRERTRLLEIENLQKELELKQLNEQLNPHFLFNALNNIYSHQLRQSSDGKELILKLSELMRYVLDSSKKTLVPLHEEIRFIEHYIAFEKERLGERCHIEYTKDVNEAQFSIVPLILFNLIENAFKHGTNSVARSQVSIHLFADEELLRLTVLNTVFDNPGHSTKLGLSNTRRRLDLLYADGYKLDIDNANEKYYVMLEIKNRL